MNTLKVKEALNRCCLDDIGERDGTSQLIFPDNAHAK
ncbi:nicotinate-nucleotide diphosphorylase (carboxylating), partial [Bacillus mycoides]|nr:nicotinate-nucleotide diphosphorylase (carboxylating) [Bacillus mycoides]